MVAWPSWRSPATPPRRRSPSRKRRRARRRRNRAGSLRGSTSRTTTRPRAVARVRRPRTCCSWRRRGADVAAGDLITVDGQIEWGGVLLGSGTAYRWSGDDDALTGWEDTPSLDRGNVT